MALLVIERFYDSQSCAAIKAHERLPSALLKAASGHEPVRVRAALPRPVGTGPSAESLRQFPRIKNLSDFCSRKAEVGRLLEVMRNAAPAPDGSVLGLVGEEHLKARIDSLFGVKEDRWWYFKYVSKSNDDVPFTLEVAVAETERRGRLFHGVNFSPTFGDPLGDACMRHNKKLGPGYNYSHNLSDFLARLYIQPGVGTRSNVMAVFHLACPTLQHTDKGKTQLIVPDAIEHTAAECLWKAGRVLWHEEARRRREAAARGKPERMKRPDAQAGDSLLPCPMPKGRRSTDEERGDIRQRPGAFRGAAERNRLKTRFQGLIARMVLHPRKRAQPPEGRFRQGAALHQRLPEERPAADRLHGRGRDSRRREPGGTRRRGPE